MYNDDSKIIAKWKNIYSSINISEEEITNNWESLSYRLPEKETPRHWFPYLPKIRYQYYRAFAVAVFLIFLLVGTSTAQKNTSLFFPIRTISEKIANIMLGKPAENKVPLKNSQNEIKITPEKVKPTITKIENSEKEEKTATPSSEIPNEEKHSNFENIIQNIKERLDVFKHDEEKLPEIEKQKEEKENENREEKEDPKEEEIKPTETIPENKEISD
ncbi:MAG: hypothetical protein WCP39_08305 [Chlamydiota bacterium]